MNDRPTPDDIADMIGRMELAGWERRGFTMTRGGHTAVVGIDGNIRVTGPKDDQTVNESVAEIEALVQGNRWGHDA